MSSSLEAMISEVEYEVGQRKRVYGRIAAANPSKAGECDMHMARMVDVLAYLKTQLAEREPLERMNALIKHLGAEREARGGDRVYTVEELWALADRPEGS